VTAYGALAEHYDGLMSPADYGSVVRRVLSAFAKAGVPPGASVVDLACGTGTVAAALAERGYDLTGIDSSPDMLAVAAGKTAGRDNPMWLCQAIQALDLNDTVDAAVCCFDGLNYIVKPNDLRRALARVSLFLKPGGLFFFDALPPGIMADKNGKTFSSETDNAFCVWQSVFTGATLYNEVDLFTREGELWRRVMETHVQRAYTKEELTQALANAGFGRIRFTGERRWWVTARKFS
jgi:ubiquinone/menaquinone biosynthesis C-methylase UbiE